MPALPYARGVKPTQHVKPKELPPQDQSKVSLATQLHELVLEPCFFYVVNWEPSIKIHPQFVAEQHQLRILAPPIVVHSVEERLHRLTSRLHNQWMDAPTALNLTRNAVGCPISDSEGVSDIQAMLSLVHDSHNNAFEVPVLAMQRKESTVINCAKVLQCMQAPYGVVLSVDNVQQQ
eukprot:6089962-Amphidinium_carterae.1